jgi:hypothetical protein
MVDKLAPYEVHRLWDGEVCWVLKDMRRPNKWMPQIVGIYDDKEEAEQERNRRNSAHALDTLGIF